MKAEFHDIGKLINWAAVGLQQVDEDNRPEKEPHDFEKCLGWEPPIDFNSSVWQVIYRKDDIETKNDGKGLELRKKHWPDSLVWLWTSLGDQLAAGWGRGAPEDKFTGEPVYGRHCLWTGKQDDDPRLKTQEKLDEMIRFLNGSPSWEEAERKYGTLWFERAETARPGLNVTTLHAHSTVAGKISQVLSKIPNTGISPDATWKQAQKRFNQIKLSVVHVSVGFFQRPFRVSEWNIFRQRSSVMQDVRREFSENVIGHVGNQLICIFSSTPESKALASKIANEGFCIDWKIREANVSDLLKHGLLGVLKDVWDRYYLSAPPGCLSPPICEVCQMAHADKRWPADHLADRSDLQEKSKRLLRDIPWRELAIEDFPPMDHALLAGWFEERGEEELCSQCFEMRRSAQGLHKLPNWQDSSVAWIRISLNLDRLTKALEHLHKVYVKECVPGIADEVIDQLEVKYPLLVDFFDDYRRFLNSFNTALLGGFQEESVEHVDEDLWCIRLEHRSQALDILKAFRSQMSECFPKLMNLPLDVACPVRLALSISPYKHPFFSHLRHLQAEQADISVQLVNSGIANIPLPFLQETLSALDHGKRRALHRLRGIAQTSQKLAEIALQDRLDKDRSAFEKLNRLLPQKVSFQSLLTLTNLVEKEE